ncbi:MAG TPA: Hpt domain-containing protein [Phycisphaerales bacterium]|nr:Hpt domain-containing protein [Phycisphaerales bacterium]
MNETPSQSVPAIDVPLLLDRCMDDAALAIMVLESFRNQAESDLAELDACVGKNDSEAVSRRAHALKGTSGAVAASTLMDAACRLEEAACSQMVAEFGEHLRAVRAEMHRCLDALPAVTEQLRVGAGK